MKLYKIADGTTRWYNEADAPTDASPIKKSVAPVQKQVEETENKAVSAPKNKTVKGNRK